MWGRRLWKQARRRRATSSEATPKSPKAGGGGSFESPKGAATPGSPANNADPPPGPEKWGEVILTISNSVLPLEKLSPTPSSVDGMSQAVEDDLRNLGCNLRALAATRE